MGVAVAIDPFAEIDDVEELKLYVVELDGLSGKFEPTVSVKPLSRKLDASALLTYLECPATF